MTLGEYVKTYLETHNISQRQFAKDCNVSNGTISLLIRHINPRSDTVEKKPALSTLWKLAHGMGITIDELIEAVDDIDVDISASGNCRNITNKAPTLQDKINRLDDVDRIKVEAYIDGLLANEKYEMKEKEVYA